MLAQALILIILLFFFIYLLVIFSVTLLEIIINVPLLYIVLARAYFEIKKEQKLHYYIIPFIIFLLISSYFIIRQKSFSVYHIWWPTITLALSFIAANLAVYLMPYLAKLKNKKKTKSL